MKVLLTAATLFLLWQEVHLQSTYCDITKLHTMCKFTEKGPACADPYSQWIPSSTDIESILKWHNAIRSLAASGLETKTKGGTLPKACNMRKLSWDKELATIAQRLADQCVFAHECDDCSRAVLNNRISGVGQNIAQGMSSDPGDTRSFTEIFDEWYTNEVGTFDVKIVPSYVDGGWGHYSQLIWGETSLIGCGGSTFKRKDGGEYPYAKLIVCNYGVAANLPGAPVYKTGESASCCPAGASGSLCD